MTELRACPFCGGDVQAWEPPDCDFPHVSCLHCDARLDANTMPRAIAAWNRRADDWMPIETAPRDGTEVLTWDGMSTRVLHWFEGANEALWINEEGTPCEGATHWRPLPEGPR